MEPIEIKVKGRVKLFEPNQSRQSFCIKVLNKDATLVVEWSNISYGVPGNDATVQIESAIPWKGEIFASSSEELAIQAYEIENAG